jgi:transposase
MHHVAIDLGGKESWICVRNEVGRILDERRCATRHLGRFLRRQPTSRVVVETCAEAFHVADAALEAEHEVRVVPAMLVRSLGVGSRRTKTDQRDARILSEVSCRIDLPSVHVPTAVARERRALCTLREQLVGTRTALINCARGWARQHALHIRSGKSSTLPDRLRAAALKTELGLPEAVERLLVVIAVTTEQIAAADKELLQLAEYDPICQRLLSVPGVGPVSALRFAAAIDDIGLFPTAHSVQAFLGLTPGENSSSERKQRTGITKAGPAPVRRCLVQAAWIFRRLRPQDPISCWAAEIEKRRGKSIATVAVARKLAGVLFAIWRDGSRYEPQHERRRTTGA